MDRAKFEAWFEGDLPDSALTAEELVWIQDRTAKAAAFAAAEKRALARDETFVFTAHETVQ